MIYKRIKDVAVLLNGYAFKSKEYVESGIRVIRIANVQDGYISDEKPCFYPHSAVDEIDKYMLQEGDLLISLTGNVGRVGILTPEFIPAALNQRVSCIRIKPDSELDLSFLYYYLLRKQFVRDCIKASKGVAQLNLSTKWLENYLIPVPDLELQKRIVSQIEESLSQLDSAVKTLKKTKQQLEVYRQAVLREVFSNYDTWKKLTLKELAQEFRNGYSKKPDDKGRYKILRISAVRAMSINLNDYRRNITPFHDNDIIRPYDLLFTRYNGSADYVGVCSCVPEIKDCFAYPDKIIRCRLKEPDKYLAKFLEYYLNHGEARQYIRNHIKTTSGQNGIASSDIQKVTVYVPDKLTQKAIVKEIEAKLSNCEMIEHTVNQSLQQAEALRQSILKQAFEEDKNV